MFQPNRPTRSTWLSSASSAMASRGQRAARAPVPRERRRDRLQHHEPPVLRATPGGVPCAARRRGVDGLEEPALVHEQVAPRELDHRVEVAGGHVERDLRDGPLDGRGPAGVVQLADLPGEQPQRLARPAGEEPLLERAGHLADVLEPARGTRVQEGDALRRASRDLGEELLPDHGVHLEPAGRAEPGDEQPAGLGVGEQVARVGAAGQGRGERRRWSARRRRCPGGRRRPPAAPRRAPRARRSRRTAGPGRRPGEGRPAARCPSATRGR